jgi:hypothetical protein
MDTFDGLLADAREMLENFPHLFHEDIARLAPKEPTESTTEQAPLGPQQETKSRLAAFAKPAHASKSVRAKRSRRRKSAA